MDIYNILKIITSIITVIFTLIAGYIELRKNPDYWLNRWFAIFFVSAAFGFLAYTIYHINTLEPYFIIPIMITAQFLYNFAIISLVMTVFILEKSEKLAMTSKYLGRMAILFTISIFGYFIWTPTLNMERYKQGIIDTETPIGWFIFVNIWRLVLFIFVLYKYAIVAKSTQGVPRQQVLWFFAGSFIVIVAILLNLIGGIIGSILIEILGLIAFDVGVVFVVKGFLIK
ncbi:MAG: hypothetical protein ACFFDK_19945 [Promethearchaeota archaeon]